MEEIVYEASLEPLKKVLPNDGVVGYVTDEGADPSHKINYFYLTQYNLCPVLLVRGAHHPLVVGGYYEVESPGKSEVEGLALIKDFGRGIGLYRGKQE